MGESIPNDAGVPQDGGMPPYELTEAQGQGAGGEHFDVTAADPGQEQQHDLGQTAGYVDDGTQTTPRAEIMDESGEAFHSRMDQLIEEGRDILVFRGAGTKNGISAEDLPKAVEKINESLQKSLDAGRKVAIMFDGDEDNRSKPDIGAVFGMVADTFKDNPDVAAVAAQQQSWYYPKTEGGALESATGTPFETYVFPDSTPGGHAALTQSDELAQYDGYRQVFVGPAGAIAADQLRDFNDKAASQGEELRKANVLAIATHNNPDLTQEFQDKLQAADEDGDTTKANNFRATLQQREEQPYGMMYTADGYKTFEPSEYPNLDIEMDESLVPEFQQMREAPLKDTYETDSELAHDKAHVLNKAKGQDQVDFLLSDKSAGKGYNIHRDSIHEKADEANPGPYYTIAVRNLLKRIDKDPQYLDGVVEKLREEVLVGIVAARASEEVNDFDYAARIREYANPSAMYKKAVNELIDSAVYEHFLAHRRMDG